jgi:hypothetical protein
MRLFQFLARPVEIALGTIKAWAAFHRLSTEEAPKGEFGVYLVFRWHEPALRMQDPRSLVRAPASDGLSQLAIAGRRLRDHRFAERRVWEERLIMS